MAIRNDDGRAELAAKLDQLYGIVDELPLLGLDEADRGDIFQSIASEMEEEYSPFARLGRAEAAGNAGTGLGAYDPARIGGGYSFEPIVMGREEYMRVGAALAEAVRDVDADVFDMEDELADRAAFAMVGRGYLKPDADREEAFMADPELHASFADAWEKARYLQAGFPLLGGLRSGYNASDGEGDSEKSVPEVPKPRVGPRERPAERKGFVARHRKAIGIGIAGLFAAAAGFGIYTVMNNTSRNQFTRAAQAKGVTAEEAGRIYDGMSQAANSDRQITISRQAVLDDTAQAALDLGLVNKHPTIDTLHALGNLTVACKQHGLPVLSNDAVWALANATQASPHTFGSQPDVFDPTPIVLKGVNGEASSSMTITPVPALQAYVTANQLKAIKDDGFDIGKHTEMYAGVNSEVVTGLWCGFDNPGGLSAKEKVIKGVTLTPASQGFKDLLKLQWNLYSQFTSQRANASTVFNRDFPWYDSAKLDAMYDDKGQMKAALFGKFYIPAATYSIKDGKVVAGVEGAKIDLQQSYDGYKAMMKAYPDGKVPVKVWGDIDPRFFYYQWLDDRGHNGLENTVSQYVGGWDDSEINRGNPDQYDPILKHEGMDQYMTKNWKSWDLVKFISGYAASNTSAGGDLELEEYIIPSILRMAGFPVYHVNIEPTPKGAANREWAIGLPPYVADSLAKSFPDAKPLLGPGYTFGLYNSDANSLTKDEIENAYVFLGYTSIYLKK